MALAGDNGVDVTLPNVPNPAAILFGEDQGRFVVTDQRDPEAVIARGHRGRHLRGAIGTVGGDRDRPAPASLSPSTDLRAAHEGFFPELMGADAALA